MDTPVPTWADLTRKVEEQGGSFVTSMHMLKTLMTGEWHGRRVSERLVARVTEELSGRRLGHFPDPLPQRQEDLVLVYLLDCPGGEVLEVLRRRTADGGSLRTLAEAVKEVNHAYTVGEGRRQAALDAARPRRLRAKTGQDRHPATGS